MSYKIFFSKENVESPAKFKFNFIKTDNHAFYTHIFRMHCGYFDVS